MPLSVHQLLMGYIVPALIVVAALVVAWRPWNKTANIDGRWIARRHAEGRGEGAVDCRRSTPGAKIPEGGFAKPGQTGAALRQSDQLLGIERLAQRCEPVNQRVSQLEDGSLRHWQPFRPNKPERPPGAQPLPRSWPQLRLSDAKWDAT